MRGLRGRTYIVTGCASGIGRATATRLAEEGATVMGADLSDPSGHSISIFVAADQLLKGAALNAVQIAELLPERAVA